MTPFVARINVADFNLGAPPNGRQQLLDQLLAEMAALPAVDMKQWHSVPALGDVRSPHNGRELPEAGFAPQAPSAREDAGSDTDQRKTGGHRIARPRPPGYCRSEYTSGQWHAVRYCRRSKHIPCLEFDGHLLSFVYVDAGHDQGVDPAILLAAAEYAGAAALACRATRAGHLCFYRD
jgi:hypothetical protein